MHFINAYIARMDINTLEIFVDVMQRLNFADVARLRMLAPSSVSRTIAQLEKDLGVCLFHRSTRKLEPTQEALTFYERIRPVLEEVESACQQVKDTSEAPKGKLRMTAASVYAQKCVVPLLPEFSRLYPEIEVELIMTDAHLDLVEEHIDLAIRLGRLEDSSMIARRLNDLRFRVCASKAYLNKHGTPSIPSELSEQSCLLFHRNDSQPSWLFKNNTGEIEKVSVKGQYLMTNSEAVLNCTEAGMGVALLPDWLADKRIQKGKLVELFNDYDVTRNNFDDAIWMVYPTKKYLPVKVRMMMDFLIEHSQV